MNENVDNYNINKITESIISYLEFVNKFKNAKSDEIIFNESDNSNSKFSYIFRDFMVECYIIDKKSFDIFRSSINFNNLHSLLNPINEENTTNLKKN